MNSPAGSATALAVGTGNGEFDNIVFNGTGLIPFMGSTLAEKITNAKIAILATPGATNQSNGMNWLGEDNTSTNPLYADYENLLINSLNIFSIASEDAIFRGLRCPSHSTDTFFLFDVTAHAS